MLTVLREAWQGWNRHHTPHLAAALSFYLALSLAPLLVIAIAITGLVIGPRLATQDVLGPLNAFIGTSGARFLGNLVSGLTRPAPNVIAATLGIAALIFGASGAFIQLQDALNIVFDAQTRAPNVWRIFQVRFLGFLMALIIGMLVLGLQLLNAFVAAFAAGPADPVRGGFFAAAEALVSLAVIGALFAVLFRYVPDTRIAWRNALVGGLFTAFLFLLGQWALSMYVGHSALRSIHGAAAAALIILTWLYYSSSVVFLGAEFTRAYALHRRQNDLPGLEAS
jgi:membrane protein